MTGSTVPPKTLESIQTELANGALDSAFATIQSQLSAYSDDPNLGYLKALYYRLAGEPQLAIETLGALTARYPDMARAHQEVALNSATLGLERQCRDAAEAAVNLDASLLQCWRLLEKLYQRTAPDKVAEVQQQIEMLEELPTELRTVVGYISTGQLNDAERLAKYFLRSNKTHPEGMRLLAEALTRKGVLDEAQFVLETLHELQPEHTQVALQLFHVLMRRQRSHAAFDIALKLKEQHPADHQQVRVVYAAACFAVGRTEEAAALYAGLQTDYPDDHLIPINQGHIYNAEGERALAVSAFQKSIELNPLHGDAYWCLANTKSYKFDASQILKMREVEGTPQLGDLDKAQLCFAIGKAYEDAGEYEESFDFYDKGNQIKRRSSHFNSEQLEKRISSQIKVCTPQFFQDLTGTGVSNPDPIFIVGMPRAGSTLLEQILASHSAVDGTMELHNILDLAKRLRGRDLPNNEEPRYPKILMDLDHDLFRQFGEQFLDHTQVYRGDAPFFIDKMPNNFFHIGLIKLILPNAKVIDARRHPMACCFSGFKQLWGEGQEFSYGLEQIGTYYRQYVRLMAHWDQVLPDFVLRVQHEDVVDDLEGQVRRLLDFCDLPFESACLDFHKTDRTVRTPSAEQVRQPIYRSGLDQWRNFEKHLDPLKAALGEELLESYDIAPPQ